MLEIALHSVALHAPQPTGTTMQTMPLENSFSGRKAPPLAVIAAELDDARRYRFTDGFDADDADLGWVDVDVVREPRRLH